MKKLVFSLAIGAAVAAGSYNYSDAASTTNDENLVILQDSATAADYEAQFNRMWNDTKNFAAWS
ncbi:hypothetical protein GCM10025857_31230 [Alicyclobacillus contaminans]|uniref:phospholipase D-like domain-containing protein n=1 Tax=Alicyclobacillus contaminans TaxID=392016 RepID=UPI0003FCD5B4|nr:phospholipase D-like domain-containing protein [Alicyclobacillus contaminans]GMA51766.1 hypothetical protein GCM10025857_31230 [Alicyclobacillus contaminans]